MSKAAVAHIIDTLGSEALQHALGVTRHSIKNARWEGVFPSAWFDRVDALCRDAGIECPRECFKWRYGPPAEDAAA